MADYTLTDEQLQIVDRARQRWSYVIEAGAGTGKTSTLVEISKAVNARSMLYVAYNKDIVTDSRNAFGDGVTCSTAHSLAYRAVGYQYGGALKTGAIQGWQLAKALGVRRWASGKSKLSGPLVASTARRTVKAWAMSVDPVIMGRHVPVPESITDPDARAELVDTVLGYAQRMWAIAQNPNQRMIRFDHDWYLKLFSMSGPGGTVPALPVDLFMFDECQDADRVISLIFESQPGCQRIAVGDTQQTLYAWRGAENAIARFREAGAPMFPLSTSWRFGQVIADQANGLLDRLDAEIRLTGNPAIESRLGDVNPAERHAVLCRTNAGVMEVVVRTIAAGVPVAMVGGGKEVKALASACEKLHAGTEVDHSELIGFTSWSELVDFTEGPDCDNPTLRTLVRLATTFEPSEVRRALDACVDERQATVIASTGHRSKGRQWSQVRISPDFAATGTGLQRHNPYTAEIGAGDGSEIADLRLAYVATTRARHVLDHRVLRDS